MLMNIRNSKVCLKGEWSIIGHPREESSGSKDRGSISAGEPSI